jgi:hypothetical protein
MIPAEKNLLNYKKIMIKKLQIKKTMSSKTYLIEVKKRHRPKLHKIRKFLGTIW